MSKENENNLPSLAKATVLPSMADGLTRYLSEIRRFPILEPDEEYMLAKRWQEHQDPKAAERLVSSHLRLVAKIAGGYRGYGLPMIDLIAEGNVGLMQALRKFDPDKGFRFSTYAMWWIRASMQEYILHSWSLVKIGTTAAQKKLFFNLRRLKGEMQTADEIIISDKTIKDIASELNVSETEVIEMSKRLGSQDQSLNAPLKAEGNEEWQDWLVDEESNHESKIMDHNESQHKNALLETAMKSLNEREYLIIKERRLKEPPETLESLSETLGISRERVRQLEIRAFEKIQKAVKSAALQERILE
ncbi:RNA polymerase sigma factor RpoH [Kamptonema cortianum]|nr:RNA polymerase sigma factor RpoH [Geitlerinema splendidum]MDK3161212.1 RNA polymerase sigma factor RpoH [Kamptonema cortianum]